MISMDLPLEQRQIAQCRIARAQSSKGALRIFLAGGGSTGHYRVNVRPAAAIGSRPTGVSTEKRPPMSSGTIKVSQPSSSGPAF